MLPKKLNKQAGKQLTWSDLKGYLNIIENRTHLSRRLLRIRSNYIVILMIDLLLLLWLWLFPLLLLCITYNLVRFLCIYKPTAVGTTPDVTFTNASGATESTCCRTHTQTLRSCLYSVYIYSIQCMEDLRLMWATSRGWLVWSSSP